MSGRCAVHSGDSHLLIGAQSRGRDEPLRYTLSVWPRSAASAWSRSQSIRR